MSVRALPRFHLLVVEDDIALRMALELYFETQGFQVTTASDGEKALACLEDTINYDLVLLDNMLPYRSGFDVLAQVQRQPNCPPILMMTASAEPHNILKGFDLGADDYIVKPFNIDLLMARIMAVLRRRMPPEKQPMDVERFGDVEVNFSAHTATCNGKEVHLTIREFEMLRYLIEHEGRIISRENLLQEVWKMPPTVETRTIDRHIASLRRKLGDEVEAPRYLRTVHGKGYLFTRLD